MCKARYREARTGLICVRLGIGSDMCKARYREWALVTAVMSLRFT